MSKSNAINLLVNEHREVQAKFMEFQALEKDATAQKKILAEEICQALTLHTEIEEEIFYPAVRKAIHEEDLMDEALVEHAGAKELILQIKAMEPDDDLYDAKMKVLSEQIEHHVGEEEGNMFLKASETTLDLDALGEKMAKRKQEIEAGKSDL